MDDSYNNENFKNSLVNNHNSVLYNKNKKSGKMIFKCNKNNFIIFNSYRT